MIESGSADDSTFINNTDQFKDFMGFAESKEEEKQQVKNYQGKGNQ